MYIILCVVGLYDNKHELEDKRLGEEALYDRGDVNMPDGPDYVIHRVETIVVENGYDQLTNLYDTPFDSAVSIQVFIYFIL